MITVNKKKTHENSNHGKSYLAPEVVKYRQYSPASDIYSMERMLKAIATIVGFYEKFRIGVKNATNNEPSRRANNQQFTKEIAAVQTFAFVCLTPGGGVNPYDDLYGEAPPEWGTFLRL